MARSRASPSGATAQAASLARAETAPGGRRPGRPEDAGDDEDRVDQLDDEQAREPVFEARTRLRRLGLVEAEVDRPAVDDRGRQERQEQEEDRHEPRRDVDPGARAAGGLGVARDRARQKGQVGLATPTGLPHRQQSTVADSTGSASSQAMPSGSSSGAVSVRSCSFTRAGPPSSSTRSAPAGTPMPTGRPGSARPR